MVSIKKATLVGIIALSFVGVTATATALNGAFNTQNTGSDEMSSDISSYVSDVTSSDVVSDSIIADETTTSTFTNDDDASKTSSQEIENSNVSHIYIDTPNGKIDGWINYASEAASIPMP